MMSVATMHGEHLMRAAIVAVALAAPFSSTAAKTTSVRFIRFPASDVKALGEIEKLNVSVNCSWIIGLQNVPQLYDIEMSYDMPVQNLLEARPRLGAAAVTLSAWSGVIGIRIPSDVDSKSCFAVVATAQGRTGIERKWEGRQLGLPEF